MPGSSHVLILSIRIRLEQLDNKSFKSAKKGAAKTRKTVNANAQLARRKVKKTVAKTSKTAGATARQAKSKVKKTVAKTKIEAKKITSKRKNR